VFNRRINMELSHIDNDGNPRMVDITGKPTEKRTARAQGFISLGNETLKLIREGSISKGNVLLTAQVAGIQAAKRTAELIPLCHPLALTKVDVTAEVLGGGVEVQSLVIAIGQTGVEMEALQAVSTALLTIYDMCKAVDSQMSIGGIELVEKKKEAIEGEDS
jgi:cyclic pyranopterin phosphate synthase